MAQFGTEDIIRLNQTYSLEIQTTNEERKRKATALLASNSTKEAKVTNLKVQLSKVRLEKVYNMLDVHPWQPHLTQT